MHRFRPHLLPTLALVLALAGCTASRNVTTSTPEPTPPTPTDETATAPEPPSGEIEATILEAPQDWFHLDEQEARFRGISTERAYRTLLDGKQPKKTVVVAVLDSGVDIEHEDLKGHIWTNEDEVPGNGVDDDQNGYVDDVHGWNFIGGPDGQNIHQDTYELTREYARLGEKYAGKTASDIAAEDAEEFEYWEEVKTAFETKRAETEGLYRQIAQVEEAVNFAEGVMKEHLKTETLTREQVAEVRSPRNDVQEARRILLYIYDNGFTPEDVRQQKQAVADMLEYGYNPDFDPRPIVGDDYEDPNDRFYGNNDVAGPDPSHGTAVAGVIAALRGNNVGIDGIASDVRIMPVRVVPPEADERDKDVANGIRYAVDNGADIINMSFGKSYSPYKSAVDEAVRYADEKGVLLVHGSGNDGEDVDVVPNFPTKELADDTWADNWIEVGATSWAPGPDLVASFSNYGAKEVDVFAPGVDIYTLRPGSQYGSVDGTSLSSPIVAGIAALVESYYPELTAEQLRQVIVESALTYPDLKVTVPGGENAVSFSTLSASGGIANVYTAVQAAEAAAP